MPLTSIKVNPVPDQYPGKIMHLDGDRNDNAVFEKVLHNMEIIAQNHDPKFFAAG